MMRAPAYGMALVLASCATVDPYVGKQRCGCDDVGGFACLYDDGDGVSELVIAGYCTGETPVCTVEPMETNAGDEVYCVRE